MWIVAITAAVLFWLRDYWLLQLGPRRKVYFRIALHVLLVVFAASWIATDLDHLVPVFRSTVFLLLLFGFHSALAWYCFWIRRTSQYNLVRLVAALPAPTLWVLMAQTIATAETASARSRLTLILGTVWVLSMAVMVSRAIKIQLDADAIEYIVNFAGWVNCFGAGLVILAISPAALESFRGAVRALGP